VFVLWLLLAGGVSLWTPATAQESHRDIPLHAHMAAGEQGWVCNMGFRQVVRLCIPDRHGFSTRRFRPLLQRNETLCNGLHQGAESIGRAPFHRR
jgi:hypothetical protein